VKLLLDENLSPDLVHALSAEYPGSAHVRDLGLKSATDLAVWERARSDGYTLVSKDSDFRQMSFLFGAPPRVVWVRLGNCSTAEILALLRNRRAALQSFWEDPEAAFLVLGKSEGG
jgi:predicted nuclease of predicted toxin-antitoxin system